MRTRCVFRGGLGNQMFQYALVLSLRKKGHDVIIDTSMYDYEKMHNGYELERVFGIDDNIINKKGFHLFILRLLNKYQPVSIVSFDNGLYNKNIIDSPKRFINGYWQDEKYFIDIEMTVKETFQFINIDEDNKKLASEVLSNNSVSLHIRRGDYASFGMTIMGKEYYAKAINYIKENITDPFFYVFSDDKNAAEEIISELGIKYKYIDKNHGLDSYKDMYLMSQCKHNIIANSSFSWWGAWLNPNPSKIIIAPKIWDGKNKEFHPQSKKWILY